MTQQDNPARLRANAALLRQMAAEATNEDQRRVLLRAADYYENQAESME